MSQETNNEIDLLLRRMGRRDRDGARNIEAPVDERHLDADELSSYAQNALPAAARARYTEHLAECATCRRLVTELSLSLGAAAAPVAAAYEPSGWKKFLAGLFSPLVLRYAVPALGVLVVMIVGFVVFRQQRQKFFLAELQPKERTSAVAPSPQTPPAAGFTDQQKQKTDKLENGNAKTTEPSRKTEGTIGDAKGAATAAAPAPVVSGDQAITESKVATAASTPAPTAAAPARAAEPADAPPAKTDEVAKKQEQQPKEKSTDEVARAPEPGATRGLATLEPAAGRTAQNAPKPEPSANAKVFGMSRPVARSRTGTATASAEEEKRDDANRAKAEDQDAVNDTRTIAGRHFRKRGGIWTDTAYESPTATVNMARNSEQFRALVADEPAIGTIARQLDGEVIVLWKGRAYHIR